MSTATRGVLLPKGIVSALGGVLVAFAGALPVGALALRHRYAEAPERQVRTARPEMVWLPGGVYAMGSPAQEAGHQSDEVQHQVSVARFAVSLTEITQEQFRTVMGRDPVLEGPAFCRDAGVGDSVPVVCVTWLDAIEYCNALSVLEKLDPAYTVGAEDVRWDPNASGFRLPTEAEWEYAARGGEQTVYVGTNDPEQVCRFGNVRDQKTYGSTDSNAFACEDPFRVLAPVFEAGDSPILPNRFGLRGFGGNASEWVWDEYGSYSFAPDRLLEPALLESRGSRRVIRGASRGRNRRNARVADRGRARPSTRGDYVGFRVARSE